jgi:uncharacterized membrane protein
MRRPARRTLCSLFERLGTPHIGKASFQMKWSQWYRTRSYVRSSLWIVPFIAIPLELIVTRFLHAIDTRLGWTLLDLAPSGAQAILQTLITATLSFLVFSFGSLLVAIQVASGQLTPRIIATTLLRDDVVRYTVGLFIFALLFAVSAMDRMEQHIHQFVLFVAAVLGILCFAAFLYLIDYAARLLRPISILTRVGKAGLAVIDTVYPEKTIGQHDPETRRHLLGPPQRIVPHQGKSEIVLAVNLAALRAEAERSNGVIEFVPQVGDFVALDEPLFNLYGGAGAIDENKLRTIVAFGPERTMEQDPTFALRIIIDIALRALSPAINDPTTAVLAIDQLHRLLRMVGNRHLRGDEISDSSGQLRVIFRTPNWEDFVHLGFNEIRRCGSNNMQVARRLRAMIVNLMQTLPRHRHPALQQELGLLDREIERHFSFPEDLALAHVPDSQGLGGHSGMETID